MGAKEAGSEGGGRKYVREKNEIRVGFDLILI